MLDPDDPTKVRNQPALSTSSGREWLIVGALTALICVGVLMLQVPAAAFLSITGAAVVVVIFAAMVIVRELVKPQRRRLGILATLLIGMMLVTIAALVAIVLSRVQ
jgi:hypothetical protein